MTAAPGRRDCRYSLNWERTPFSDAFERVFPTATIAGKYAATSQQRFAPVLWVDSNGDGMMQASEFDITNGTSAWASVGGWGGLQKDLTLRAVFARVTPTGTQTGHGVLALAPLGFNAVGAPLYPPLAQAFAAAPVVAGLPQSFTTAPWSASSGVDRFGNVHAISSPMVGVSPAGRALYSFPNSWNGVHGSHTAPMPATGVTQGTLFYLGVEPLDAVSDVMVVVGNMGRFFVFTSDGLYLDEFFQDVRMGGSSDDPMRIGGEAFGGVFARADSGSSGAGRYFLQAASYRIYEITGLNTTVRTEGRLDVTAGQLVLAAAQVAAARAAATAAAASATTGFVIPYASNVRIASGAVDFPGTTWAASWNGGAAKAKLAYNESALFIHWAVTDASPWVNGGADWTALFHSGDSVDVQIGMVPAPAALPTRAGPVVGDIRLLIAPYQGANIAVLYRNEANAPAPGEPPLQPVSFTSPWRAEDVADVRRLPRAAVAVSKSGTAYTVTVAVPLADLYWPLPMPLAPGASIPGLRKADIGVLYGDAAGTAVAQRSYAFNTATGLVNDGESVSIAFKRRAS